MNRATATTRDNRPPRCGAMFGTRQCEKVTGHEGPHEVSHFQPWGPPKPSMIQWSTEIPGGRVTDAPS
jgi:hypothetical protein